MSIINVNMFQNGVDKTSYLTSYTDIYLKQALANLGQRIGVRGDGFALTSFTPGELVKIEDVSEMDNYFVRAEYLPQTDEIYAYLYNDDTKKDVNTTYTHKYTTYDSISFDEPFSISEYSGDYKTWDRGGIVRKDGDIYTFTVAALDGDNYSYIISDKTDGESNLYDGLRCYKDGDLVKVYRITEKSDDTNKYVRTSYSWEDYRDLKEMFEDFKEINSPETICESICKDFDVVVSSAGADFIWSSETGESIDIAEREIVEFKRDVREWLPELKVWFNDKNFFDQYNNNSLKCKILCSIIKDAYDYHVQSSGIASDRYVMYFPITAEISCYYNTNNDVQIYNNAAPILVSYRKTELLVPDKTSITAASDVDKLVSFDFIISYYDTYNAVVKEITSFKDYVYPYIKNKYWYINDADTGQYANGADAGKPNIIMTVTEKMSGQSVDLRGRILFGSTFTGNEICEDELTVPYRVPHSVTKDNVTSTTDLTVLLPTISEYTEGDPQLTALEDALIMSLVDVKQNVELSEVLGSGFVTVFSHLVNDDGRYHYEYIAYPYNKDYPYALDINTIGNLESLIEYSLNTEYAPDRYEHTFVVFDKIVTDYKQSLGTVSSVYPTIRNKVIGNNEADPLENFGNSYDNTNNYNNQLNFVIEYNDNVEQSTYGGITGINPNNSRYFEIDAVPVEVYRYDPVGDGTYARVIDHYTYTYQLGNVINYHDYPNEVVPNTLPKSDSAESKTSYFPTVDLKEVFVRNPNTINRTNIIGIEKSDKYGQDDDFTGNIYYGYLGVSSENDRNHLKIGTSNTDINLGTSTLTSKDNLSHFNKFDAFDIDIDAINMNGNTTFTKDAFYENVIWSKQPLGDSSYTLYSALVYPNGADREMFTTVETKRKFSRYMDNSAGADNFITYSTYIDLKHLFDHIGLEYEGARLTTGNVVTDDWKMEISTSKISIDDNNAYAEYYICNPLMIAYNSSIINQLTYSSEESTYVWCFSKYNDITDASFTWHCDGCDACLLDASACPNRRCCKHTYFLIDVSLSDSYIYSENQEDITASATVGYFTYDAAVKTGIYDGDEALYDEFKAAYSDLCSFSYMPKVWGVRTDESSNGSYYTTKTSVHTLNIYSNVINVREIYTTNSTPEFNNGVIRDRNII